MATTYESRNALRLLAIVSGSFTDVQGTAVLPLDCNTVIIFNNSGVDVLLRTDPANANSEITLSTGQQFEFTGVNRYSFRYPRCGPAVCALKQSSGNVNVIVASIQ